MDAIEKYKDNISAVVFWGVTDDMSWRASQQPLIFDSEYKAKPAFYSIIEGLTPGDLPEITTKPEVTTVTSETTPEETTVTSATTTPSEGITEIIYGDVDGDGDVTLTDLSVLALYLLKETELDSHAVKCSDVDGDGDITVGDIARIKQYVSKKINDLTPHN